MQQGTDRRSEAKPREPRPADPKAPRKARSSAAPAPPSFTSQMLEYRSWWNLPRSRSRKSV